MDIYPPSSDLPARIELLGDEIESIRTFDPISQRSVGAVESVSVIPAREVLPALADKDRVSELIGRISFARCTTAVRQRFEEELASLFSGHQVEALSLYSGLLNDGSLIDHLPEDGVLVLDREAEIETEALGLAEPSGGPEGGQGGTGGAPGQLPFPPDVVGRVPVSDRKRTEAGVHRLGRGRLRL